MTPQQILIVAVRVFALFFIVNAISHLVTILRYLPETEPLPWLAVATWPFLEIIACVFLWFFPATLSRRLLKVDAEPDSAPGPALLEWQSMAIVGIGLWTLSSALPDTVYWIMYFSSWAQEDASARFGSEDWAGFASTVTKLILALWLLTGGRNVAELLFRFRTAGLKD